MWRLCCLALLACVLAADHTENEEEPKCKTLFTFGYGYRQFFHMAGGQRGQGGGDLLNMRFQVKARSDAHVLLSPTPSPEEADPVYEIVLGAGKNSFSDIRRRRRASTKASSYTKDILSGTELRSFWVRITGEGLILVGRAGEELPFMQWQDPEPLLVLYFSFCTWSGVAGKWLYDCHTGSADNTAGSTVVEPVQTQLDRLRRALLTDYDVYSRPVFNASSPLLVDLQLQTNHVHLDIKKSVMVVECLFILNWYDEKMVWIPEEFGNISVLHLQHHEIWQPQLVHFNAVEKQMRLDPVGMRVCSSGRVRWSPRASLRARCKLDLALWPWDTHTCCVQLGFWSQPGLGLLENGSKLELQRVRSEWVLEQVVTESTLLSMPWLSDSTALDSDGEDDSYTTALTFSFTLRRANIGYIYIFVIPIAVLMVLSLTCFWMDPLGKEKLSVNCLLLVLLSLFLLCLQHDVAAPAHHTPYLIRVYTWVLMVVTGETVVTALIITLLNTAHHRSPPRWITALLSNHLISSLFCLPRGSPDDAWYHQLTECDSAANLSWGRLAIFCDRMAFLTASLVYTMVLIQ